MLLIYDYLANKITKYLEENKIYATVESLIGKNGIVIVIYKSSLLVGITPYTMSIATVTGNFILKTHLRMPKWIEFAKKPYPNLKIATG